MLKGTLTISTNEILSHLCQPQVSDLTVEIVFLLFITYSNSHSQVLCQLTLFSKVLQYNPQSFGTLNTISRWFSNTHNLWDSNSTSSCNISRRRYLLINTAYGLFWGTLLVQDAKFPSMRQNPGKMIACMVILFGAGLCFRIC